MSYIHVTVASNNPAKIKAVDDAFQLVFPDDSIVTQGSAAPSRVSDQPMSDSETYLGASNRLTFIQHNSPTSQFHVSIEAGLEKQHTFAWILIHHEGKYGESRSASLPLPKSVLDGLHQGMELGDVMDSLYGTSNIKQKGGAIGLLTNSLLSRSSVYQQSLILALTPFMLQNQKS
ncbi:inosine/xanthosine triphosphatase [Vibrio sp.]|nr:inosine/xanthosine triphosphatase [Vibrio sp.]